VSSPGSFASTMSSAPTVDAAASRSLVTTKSGRTCARSTQSAAVRSCHTRRPLAAAAAAPSAHPTAGCTWRFSSSVAPWGGGAHEAARCVSSAAARASTSASPTGWPAKKSAADTSTGRGARRRSSSVLDAVSAADEDEMASI